MVRAADCNAWRCESLEEGVCQHPEAGAGSRLRRTLVAASHEAGEQGREDAGIVEEEGSKHSHCRDKVEASTIHLRNVRQRKVFNVSFSTTPVASNRRLCACVRVCVLCYARRVFCLVVVLPLLFLTARPIYIRPSFNIITFEKRSTRTNRVKARQLKRAMVAKAEAHLELFRQGIILFEAQKVRSKSSASV